MIHALHREKMMTYQSMPQARIMPIQSRRTWTIVLLLLLGVFIPFRWFDMPTVISSFCKGLGTSRVRLTCTHGKEAAYDKSNTCSNSPPPRSQETIPATWEQSAPQCPAYFRWIHEDLRPWKDSGITREMMEREKMKANFRLVVLGGRAYIERYGRRTFQTRHLFTQWGILQLLRRYPGRVPDLELMFDCTDHPVVDKAAHLGNVTAPPLFGYCSDDFTLDIVFPDWTFWGWPEVHIKPWEPMTEELEEGNRKVRWVDREPYAYWKGNPWVAQSRRDLLKCNVSTGQDWNARIYAQNWESEVQKGFKNSGLADQCRHRYKIYVEGAAWSVSQKYIMACNSPVLRVTPRYHDFYSRGLLPLRHYWPVRAEEGKTCPSVKFAVDWGNAHTEKAQAMGEAGSRFTREELKMDKVYDYMLHLLTEYAKLLRFKPAVPQAAVELCEEVLACPAKEVEREYMVQYSAAKGSHGGGGGPCALAPPFISSEMETMMSQISDSLRQVERWKSKTAG